MKNQLLFLMMLVSMYVSSQQAGTIYSYEKRFSLTSNQLLQNVQVTAQETYPTEFFNLLNQNSWGIEAYKITYWTPNYEGNLVKATGLLVYPKVNFKLSTVVYCHPTTDKRSNVPSNVKDVMGSASFVIPLSYVLNGYIVVAPDYLGMGDGDGKHPYINAKTEASATIDMTRAANQLMTQLNMKRYNEYFITGYSQGGHAVMSTIKANVQKYNSLYNFKYVFAGAGPYDLSDTTINVSLFQKEVFPFSAFLANVVNGCKIIGYNVYNTSHTEIISDNYANLYQENVINEAGGLLWGPPIWRNLFKPSFVNDFQNNPNHPLKKCLKESDVYNWYNKYPTTMQNAYLDYTIPYQNAIKTKNIQQGYYPWWDISKYKITTEIDYLTPSHIGGIVPWLISSNYIFNTKRSGGFFNQWAILQGKGTNSEETPSFSLDFNQSVIKPQFNSTSNITSYEVTPLNKIKNQENRKIRLTSEDFKNLEYGSYIMTINTIDGKEYTVPYQKIKPTEVNSKEFIDRDEKNIVLNLSEIQELKNIFVYDSENSLVLNLNKQNLIDGKVRIPQTNLPNRNYTFEIVSEMGSNIIARYENENYSPTQNHISATFQNNILILKSGETINKISVFDPTGKSILEVQNMNSREFESKPFSYKGIYIISLVDANGKQTSIKVMNK